jgi:pimeloyl-ACP methyl ester carboxylesterase
VDYTVAADEIRRDGGFGAVDDLVKRAMSLAMEIDPMLRRGRANGWRYQATAIGCALAGLVLTGCNIFLRSTPTPIPTRATPLAPAGPATTLVVFLPGRGDGLAAFEREGIVAVMREAGVRADTITVDAHLGYYFKRTVLERLQVDVLQPARSRGYRRIVLVGVSLGGLGALLNERDHPGSVDALVLLSPYLGKEGRLFERITAAGGPAAWAAGRDPLAGGVEEQIWTFLGTRSAQLPPTWLLCGTRDSLSPGHRLLAALLPAAHVTMIDGAHDWPTWRTLWRGVCFNTDLFRAEKTKETPVASAVTRPAP